MKKALYHFGFAVSIGSMLALGVSIKEAKSAEYLQLTMNSGSSDGYMFCNFNAGEQDLNRARAAGFQVISVTPMNWTTSNLGDGTVYCVGQSILMVR